MYDKSKAFVAKLGRLVANCDHGLSRMPPSVLQAPAGWAVRGRGCGGI